MHINIPPAQLRAVVALADRGTFTAAAASMGIAQSSLSRAVQDCERRLRVRIFVRTTRRVQLTAEGQEIVELARGLVADYDDGMRHLTGYIEGTHGAVRIATLPSLAATLLPTFVLRMRQRYPDVRITVDDALGGSVQERLSRGHSDVAISARSSEPPDRQREFPFAEDRFFAAVRADDPLAGADEIAWTGLSGLPQVAFSGASTIRRLADTAFASHEVASSEIVEAQNVGSVGGMVAAGLGVAVVPAFVLPLLAFADLRFVPLVPVVTRRIVVAHRTARPLSPPVRSWLELLLDPDTPRPQLAGVSWSTSQSA